MGIRRLAAVIMLFAALALAGCAKPNPPNADATEVARAAYADPGQPMITLFTVRDARSDGGAHTGLMISGAQRVLWDPAGSFVMPGMPEVNDVLFGITPRIEKVYIDYHVRPEYYMIRQDLPVDRATADALIALVREDGRAPAATCARTTSRILRTAGFDVGRTWFPVALMNDFGAIPGVTTQRIDVSNVDTDHNVIFGTGGVPLPPGA
ncbi:hypothetical protein [Palleronia rufa]|uniref:hypothetical protein n=1 Tax=Palleronia rufa TaxID=1530186 RepID=UPI00068EA9F7|nr:hypothetical protein [Palleronia rufa]